MTTATTSKTSKTNPALLPVPMDAVITEEVPETEWEAHVLVARVTERSEMQKSFDAKFKALHAKWVAMGKPAKDNSPRNVSRVAPEYEPAVKRMIQSAAALAGAGAIITPVHEKDGRVAITWAPRNKYQGAGRPKGSKNGDAKK